MERTNSYIEALKTSIEAKEKVLKRTEERYEAESKEWKEKELCFEAQLEEMQQLRERVDQLSTLSFNLPHTVQPYGDFAAGREFKVDVGAEEEEGAEEREVIEEILSQTKGRPILLENENVDSRDDNLQ